MVDVQISHEGRLPSLLFVTLTTWAALLFVSGYYQVTDPLVRHDDFPALLRQPEAFYLKTLSEGRWINYWWHLRPFQTPAWFNYQVYLFGWAVYAGSIALHTLGNSTRWYPALLAAFIAFSPQETLISLWFNTLIPGVWLIALYAAVTLWLSPRKGLWLMLAAVPLSLMTYSTYPLMILAVCLIRNDQMRSLRGLVLIIVLFAAAFAAGLLLINTLNYFEHGVFGIQHADWRNPTPAHGLDGYLANVPKALKLLAWVYDTQGFGDSNVAIISAVSLIASLTLVTLRSYHESAYLATGIAAGLGLLALHAIAEGVLIPIRATMFVWVFFGVAVGRMAWIFRDASPRTAAIGRIALMSLALVYGSLVWRHYVKLTDWQSETRQLAEAIPDETSIVYVFGSYEGVAGAFDAAIQHPRGLRLRLLYLTGIPTIICSERPDLCENVLPPFETAPEILKMLLVSEENIAYVRLPAVDLPP